MLDLLFDYVDLSMTKLCPEKGKMEELEEYYQVIILRKDMHLTCSKIASSAGVRISTGL